MQELTFDYRDIGKAPRLAWSVRKMYLALRGILFAWGIYIVFTYTALLLTPARSEGAAQLFRKYEFFPFLPVDSASIPALAVWVIGIIVMVCILLLTATAVSRIAFQDLRGNLMFQRKEATLFTKTNRGTVLFSMFALFLLVLVFVVTFALAGLVGRIPSVGAFILAFFSIPLFFWALAGIVVLLTFLFGFTIVPAIVACIEDDVLETVIQTFTTIWSKPLLFFWYQIIARVVTAFVTVLLKILSIAAFIFAIRATAPFMGNTMNEIFTISLYRIPFLMDNLSVMKGVCALNSLIGTPVLVDTASASGMVPLSGWILGIGYLLVGTWIISYAFTTFLSAQVLIYLTLYMRKEGKDLRAIERI